MHLLTIDTIDSGVLLYRETRHRPPSKLHSTNRRVRNKRRGATRLQLPMPVIYYQSTLFAAWKKIILYQLTATQQQESKYYIILLQQHSKANRIINN